MKRSMKTLLTLALSAILAFSIGALALADDDDLEPIEVQISVEKISTGEQFAYTVDGLEHEDDGIVYLPTAVVFRAANSDYVVQDDTVYFPVGLSPNTVEIMTEDDIDYVPVQETLRKLGVGFSLSGSTLHVTIW